MLLLAIFVAGYLAIVFEHPLKLNKAASALVTGGLAWTAHVLGADRSTVIGHLQHQIGEIAGILFFLLGALTIVELIDAHDGFELITARIRTRSRRKLLVTISLLAFGLSSILDNLTTSIVMISLVRRLADDEQDRRIYGGVVIIAANAGGAWSPIGDVTTTMLWVGGQITTGRIMTALVVPSIVCLAAPVLWLALRMKGDVRRPAAVSEASEREPTRPTSHGERLAVLLVGVGVLLFVPVFKLLTGLPPFVGMILGLGLMWAFTEIVHKKKNDERRKTLSAAAALQRVDSQSVLFFLGILLAIGALQSAGHLLVLATAMDRAIGNVDVITVAIGLASSVVDNVPLVAAAQGMYSLSTFPIDHRFWVFLAYCAGTGGSLLVIGSAAGIAVMGIQRITFGWYLRHMSLPALIGYFVGAATYLLMAGP